MVYQLMNYAGIGLAERILFPFRHPGYVVKLPY